MESVDGVDLSDEDTGTHALESSNTSLTDITVTCDDGDFTSDHDVCGTLDTIHERFPAAVQVVKLGLGDGVVDVDGRAEETMAFLFVLQHAVKVVYTGGGLFRYTVAVLEHLWIFEVDESCEVTAVVEDQVEGLVVLESLELLLQAPLVFLLGFTLPGKAVRCQR